MLCTCTKTREKPLVAPSEMAGVEVGFQQRPEENMPRWQRLPKFNNGDIQMDRAEILWVVYPITSNSDAGRYRPLTL